jgi:uncharacterized protein
MNELSPAVRSTLIDVARLSILSALHSPVVEELRPEAYPSPLRATRASFVSLQSGERLRGCCGTLEPHRPLVLDVWQSARAAACEDRRFKPVRAGELDRLDLTISVLSPLERIVAANQLELLAGLRPGVDGLYLKLGMHRATFLPKVWEQLPEREEFLHQLKLKAGLEDHFWCDEIEWFHYTAESFGARFRTAAVCH